MGQLKRLRLNLKWDELHIVEYPKAIEHSPVVLKQKIINVLLGVLEFVLIVCHLEHIFCQGIFARQQDMHILASVHLQFSRRERQEPAGGVQHDETQRLIRRWRL